MMILSAGYRPVKRVEAADRRRKNGYCFINGDVIR
jgi:hypothetical protein